MAHLIFDYSANIPTDLLNIRALMGKLHQAAAESGAFPLSGMRSRAVCCEEFLVAAGDPDTGYINLSMRVGSGRNLKTRMAVGEQLFEIMLEHLQPVFAQQKLTVSFEMRELEQHLKFNRNNF